MTRRQKRRERTEEGVSLPPPDRGVRLDWTYMPRRVRSEIERWLGGVVIGAVTQPTGFTPGVAARLTADDGRRVFVKAVGPEPNADAPSMHRRETSIVTALLRAAPVPRLLCGPTTRAKGVGSCWSSKRWTAATRCSRGGLTSSTKWSQRWRT